MEAFKKLRKDKLGMMCLSFIIIVGILGVLAPYIAPHDPAAIDIKMKLEGISTTYPLGTDQLGRCVLSRLLYGIRTTLGLALLTMIITIFIGIVLGLLAGYFKGWVDEIIMRICDIMLSFPGEVMILAIVGIMGPSIKNLVIATVIAKWAWYTRMIRSIIIQYSDKNYIKFAKVSVCSTMHIMVKHLIPGAMGEILVLSTLDTGASILNISALSFLGLGVQAPAAEWGMMLSEAKNVMMMYPYQMLPSGIAILLVVAAFNFLGDSLQEAFGSKDSNRKAAM